MLWIHIRMIASFLLASIPMSCGALPPPSSDPLTARDKSKAPVSHRLALNRHPRLLVLGVVIGSPLIPAPERTFLLLYTAYIIRYTKSIDLTEGLTRRQQSIVDLTEGNFSINQHPTTPTKPQTHQREQQGRHGGAAASDDWNLVSENAMWARHTLPLPPTLHSCATCARSGEADRCIDAGWRNGSDRWQCGWGRHFCAPQQVTTTLKSILCNPSFFFAGKSDGSHLLQKLPNLSLCCNYCNVPVDSCSFALPISASLV
jgi:hypothetical protein